MTAARLRWTARGEHELPAGEDWLTPEEVRRAAGLRFTKRRSEFLLRRWTAKQAVAVAHCGVPLGEGVPPSQLARIEVGNRPDGSPFVRVDGDLLPLDVTLSDRAGWAVCLLGAGAARVGCDLELVEPRTPGFVRDFLTPREQAYVGQHDPAVAANLMWSAKESALKVLRTGLRRDTRSVEVSVSEPGPSSWGALQLAVAGSGAMTGWWTRQGSFLVTVVADRPMPPPTVLPRSADLRAATPVHSWLRQPVVPEAGTS